jgi:hypothetical protein
MQITPHTRKYVRNVFETLLLPWECYPQKYIGSVRNLLAKHYSDKNMRSFDKGEEINRAWLESDKKTFSPALLDFAKVRTESIVFYGAGRNMKHFLKKISDFGVRFDFRIWDADHENIREIIGKEVTAPDFETPAEKGAKAVITISNQGVVDLIGPKLENAGYEVFDDIVSMLRHMRDMRR